MRFSFLISVLLVISTELSIAQDFHQKSSVQIIKEALDAGRINEEEAMDLKIKIIRGETLPEQFRSDVPIKCGFGIVTETHEYFKKHPDKKLSLQKIAMQLVYNHSFVTNGQTKTFRINYDISGPEAVPSLDLNANSLPDWVEETGIAFERSYRMEVDSMGYREPLSFAAFGYYEIFILDDLIDNAYGYTDYIDPPITSNPDTYASYITIENDYSEGFATHGYDALRVTIGHEFFHAIQMSYNLRWSDAWYYELSSTWMEDVTYDDVNDYYAYLPGYFNSPQTSLDNTDGYSAAHWNHMIEKKYGRNTIRKSWDYMISRSAIQSIDDAIKWASSSDLSKNFSEFTVWNYYTAWRADMITYFPEASHYPKIKLLTNSSLRDTSIQREVPTLAANYYSFYAEDTVNCEINFDAMESNKYFDVITIEYNKATDKRYVMNHDGSSDMTIDNLLPGDTLLFIIVNKVIDSGPNRNYGYYLSLSVNKSFTNLAPLSNLHFYPSPFVLGSGDDKMKFNFRLRKTSTIDFRVYTIAGKLLLKTNYGVFDAGVYDGSSNLYWDGKDSKGNFVPSGVYIYQFTGNGFKKTGKIAVVR